MSERSYVCVCRVIRYMSVVVVECKKEAESDIQRKKERR